MKKYLGILLSVILLLLVSGCSGTQVGTVSKGNAVEIAASIAASQADMPQMSVLSPEDDYFITYLNFYGIEKSLLADGAIGYAGGAEASEIAVMVVLDESGVGTVEDALKSYIERRVDSFRGYVPDQAELVEKGEVVVNGRYVALLITEDNETAQGAFLNSFDDDWSAPVVRDIFMEAGQPSDEAAADEQETEAGDDSTAGNEDTASSDEESPDPAPEGQEGDDETQAVDEPGEAEGDTGNIVEDDENESAETGDEADAAHMEGEYDNEALLAVWRGGDAGLMSDKTSMVYEEAVRIIGQVITPSMSELEKELAIHDYIIDNGKYDPEAVSNAPDASPDPDNDNPYGMLINGVGICKGYTSTFQLFMDMLDITCISVDGFSGAEPHAWNMVQLDGVWYCVDVTWDDTENRHRFFNVTSQFMRETNHQWDESTVPEAVSE